VSLGALFVRYKNGLFGGIAWAIADFCISEHTGPSISSVVVRFEENKGLTIFVMIIHG
jgi:hypothetical protein